MFKKNIIIYTDASFCKESSLAVLGYAYLLDNIKFLKTKDLKLIPIKAKNNIRAEIKSALIALENCSMSANIILYTDCKTICGLIDRRMKLENTNFISKSKGTEINNADLYKKFYILFDKIQPKIIWLKGHMAKNKQSDINKNFSLLDKAVRSELRRSRQ